MFGTMVYEIFNWFQDAVYINHIAIRKYLYINYYFITIKVIYSLVNNHWVSLHLNLYIMLKIITFDN